jgi:ABC-type glycerol-3-phosphate transport system substrate-binding protein
MKYRLHLFFAPVAFMALLLALAACNLSPGVLDIQVVPAEQAQPPQVNLDPIQPVSIAFLSGGLEERRAFVKYTTSPCTTASEPAGLPRCTAGEAEGTRVTVFPLGGVQPSFLRPEEIVQRLDLKVKDLYAVYRVSEPTSKSPGKVIGEYGLIFDHEEGEQSIPVTAFVQDGELVRLDYHNGMTAEEVLNAVPLAQVILPPQQARAWSEPLLKLQLQSQTEISPDRQWSAQFTVVLPLQGGEKYYRRLTVASQDGSRSYTLVDEWVAFGQGYKLPRPLAWFGMSSTEYPVLYWTYVPVIDNCQTFYNGTDLHRLDLQSGTAQRLLDDVGTWLAISPDQSRAAVVSGARLGIYDLSSGQGHFTDLPDGQAGQVIWSPDGREVALTIADREGNGSLCATAQSTTHTILRIDADTLEVRLRLAHEARRLVTQSWSQLGLIKLTDPEAKSWLLDPQTGEVWDAATARPSTTPFANSPAQIHFYASLYEQDVAALRKLAAQFTVENPGMQVIFTDPPQVMYNSSRSREDELSAILGENDCFVSWAMPVEYPRRSELLLDLSPFLATAGAELSQDYWPEQLDGYRLDGKLYGLPMFERPSMIHFNADLLATKGLPAPAPDWTFDDFRALLTAVSSGQSGNKVYGFSADEGSLGQFIEGLFTPIFDLSTNPPTARFVSPEMAAGLESLAELRRSGAIVFIPGTLYAGQDYYDTADAWLAGRLAFWQIPFGESSPFPAVEQAATFQIGLAPLPAHGALFRNGYSVQQGFYVGKNSPYAGACWAWYRYVTGHPEAMSSAPALRSMTENVTWRARVGEANAMAIRTALERVYTEPPHFSTMTNPEFPLVIWLYNAVTDYLKGAEAQKVMPAAQSRADSYTACILPQIGLSGEALSEAVINCARRADPSLGW